MSRFSLFMQCRSGAAIIEFALLAPVVLMLLFGVIETSRFLWTQQRLDEVAFSTARCMSVSPDCASIGGQRDFAVERALHHGIAIDGSQVVPAAGAACNGFGNSSIITIDTGFSSVMTGFVPGFPKNVRASACYPAIS